MRINLTLPYSKAKAQTVPAEKSLSGKVTHSLQNSVPSSTKTQNLVSQLPQLLLSINSLQRLAALLFSPLNADTTKPFIPIPKNIQPLFQQLFSPKNQTSLISWLQQGGERKPLAQIIQQLSKPESPLNEI